MRMMQLVTVMEQLMKQTACEASPALTGQCLQCVCMGVGEWVGGGSVGTVNVVLLTARITRATRSHVRMQLDGR